MTKRMCKHGTQREGKKAFAEFKDECLRQVERLGLKDWDITIEHKELVDDDKDDAALTQFTEEGRVAIITLNKNFTPQDPRRIAKHEVGHVLLGRIHIIAGKRWTSEKEMDDEIESLCTRLEKVL